MRNRISNTAPRRSGLTLIDLTVTILLMGIIAAVTAPRFSDSLSFYRADAAAERLATDLRMLQRLSVQRSQPFSLRVRRGRGFYDLIGLDDPDRPGEPYRVELDEYPYQARIAKLSFPQRDEVTVDIHGHFNFGGEIVVTSGASSKTVVFDETTGEVTVQ